MTVTVSPQAIRAARESAGLSLRQASRELPASKQSIVDWEAGRAMPGADRIGRMAAVYGVEVGDLYTTAETTKPAPVLAGTSGSGPR